MPTTILVMLDRRILLAAFALALAIPASAPARQSARPSAPKGFKAFLLNYNEPPSRNFSRTPSFAWKPVTRALDYEFQLSTSRSFRENGIVWSSETIKAPFVSIPVALPWVTGKPYSLFARVRARTQRGMTRWTKDFGFNVRWKQIPAQLSAPNGILRWTPIDGASAYQVLEMSDPSASLWGKIYSVATNVTDMRDWFTLHSYPGWTTTAYWRVRGIRTTYGTTMGGQPATSYGPWSPLFRTTASSPSATRITLDRTVSDRTGTVARPVAHELMPGLSWASYDSYGLYRPYVFSDENCIQPVFVGSIVGSPAWVPRLSGALELPTTDELVDSWVFPDGEQTGALGYSLLPVTPDDNLSSSDGGGGEGDDAAAGGWRGDLWDREWPSGVYYWTVIPVEIYVDAEGTIAYRDIEAPQDACAARRIGTFGRVSKPIPTTDKKAYVIGLTSSGRMRSMAANRSPSPRVYGSPLVTWTPVIGAEGFEIQWSRKRYPFSSAGSILTPATSASLSLEPGSWYYRVRGIDLDRPTSAQAMSWSSVRKIRVAKPVFRVR